MTNENKIELLEWGGIPNSPRASRDYFILVSDLLWYGLSSWWSRMTCLRNSESQLQIDLLNVYFRLTQYTDGVTENKVSLFKRIGPNFSRELKIFFMAVNRLNLGICVCTSVCLLQGIIDIL